LPFYNISLARKIVHFLAVDKGVEALDSEREARRLADESTRLAA